MISILLCARNAQSYIESCIISILQQSYRDFELIIVVNDSTDDTLSIVKSFEDERIMVIESVIGQLSFNLNLALHHSTGKYIARIDADDLMFEDRLAVQFKVIEESNYDVVGSNIALIDTCGAIFGEASFPESNSDIRNKIYYRSVIAHPSVLIRRSVLLSVSGYLGGRYAQDYDLWLRLLRDPNIRFFNIQRNLIYYRVHEKQSKGNPFSYAEVASYFFKEMVYQKSIRCFFSSILYIIKALFK